MPLIIIVAHCSFVILSDCPIVINFRFTMVSDRLIWNYVILSFPIIIMNLQETFFLQMSVSEKWTYLNNRGNPFLLLKRHIRRLFLILACLEVVKSYPQMVFEQNLCKANLG